MKRPTILDAKGATLEVGDTVGGGGIYDGIILRFQEPDESHWGIAVEWDEWPGDPEIFSAPPRDYMSEDPCQCDDIERAP